MWWRVAMVVLLAASALAQTETKFQLPLPPESSFTKKSVAFAKGAKADLMVDIYRPAGAKGKLPIYLLLNGVGPMLGSGLFREHPQYAGWGKAATTVGVAGVVMESEVGHSLENFDQLAAYLRQHAEELGVDPEQVVVFSCSANVQTGMPVITDPKRSYIRGAVVYYGYGKVGTYRTDEPVLVVRAGLDMEVLNRQLDEQVAGALKVNAPWTLINLAGGNHGFDVLDDNDETRSVMQQTLAFVKRAFDPQLRAALLAREGKAEAAGFEYAKDWSKAEAAYLKILSANPKDDGAEFHLAQVLLEEGQNHQAIDHFQRALDLGNFNKGVISMMAAKAAMSLGDRETALKFIGNMKGNRPMVARLKEEPAFAPLHEDPRYKAVAESAEPMPQN